MLLRYVPVTEFLLLSFIIPYPSPLRCKTLYELAPVGLALFQLCPCNGVPTTIFYYLPPAPLRYKTLYELAPVGLALFQLCTCNRVYLIVNMNFPHLFITALSLSPITPKSSHRLYTSHVTSQSQTRVKLNKSQALNKTVLTSCRVRVRVRAMLHQEPRSIFSWVRVRLYQEPRSIFSWVRVRATMYIDLG